MKIKPAAILSVTLLFTMLGTGTASGWYSYKMGHEALKGVSQPDVNPTQKLTDQENVSEDLQEFTPLDEQKIITQVTGQIKQKQNKSKSIDSDKTKAKTTEKPKPKDANAENQTPNPVQLPYSVKDQGVTLEVEDVKQMGGAVVLEISLQNEGKAEVKFLYSFLDVKDQQGRPLSPITDGLPETLPPNREKFAGQIRIPMNVSDKEQTISLNLTDYPDQKLQLKLDNIPVVR